MEDSSPLKKLGEDSEATPSPSKKRRILGSGYTAKLNQQSQSATSGPKEVACSCTKACDKRTKEFFTCSVCCKLQHRICKTFVPLSLCNVCHSKKTARLKKQTCELKKLPITTRSTKSAAEKRIETDSSKIDKLSRRMDALEIQMAKILKDQMSDAALRRRERAEFEADLKCIMEWILKK